LTDTDEEESAMVNKVILLGHLGKDPEIASAPVRNHRALGVEIAV
jgi:single-stranded DNA-binding protein